MRSVISEDGEQGERRNRDGVVEEQKPFDRARVTRRRHCGTTSGASSSSPDMVDGLRVEIELAGPAGITATRIAAAYPRIAGFRTQTIVESLAPLPLTGATLDEAAVGDKPAATLHNFRAGADWRNPEYEGPPAAVGDPQGGTWRATTRGEPGQPVEANAEWLQAKADAGSGFGGSDHQSFLNNTGCTYCSGAIR